MCPAPHQDGNTSQLPMTTQCLKKRERYNHIRGEQRIECFSPLVWFQRSHRCRGAQVKATSRVTLDHCAKEYHRRKEQRDQRNCPILFHIAYLQVGETPVRWCPLQQSVRTRAYRVSLERSVSASPAPPPAAGAARDRGENVPLASRGAGRLRSAALHHCQLSDSSQFRDERPLQTAPSLSSSLPPSHFFSLSLPPPHKRINTSAWLQANCRARFLLRNRQPARTIRLRTTFTLRRATCLDNARWKCDDAGIDIITARSETMRGSGGGFSPSYG